MHDKQNTLMVKRLVDLCMTLLLLFLMAYQVTGEQAHEWIGMGMTALVILHQILNRTWYGAFFKGKYNAYRSLPTAVNVLLLAAFLLTALSGMAMSGYAVPFLYGLTKVSLARRVHLSLSHWTFVLMGLHLGLHIPAMLKGIKGQNARRVGFALSILLAGAGLWLFLMNNYPDYLFYRVPFAFLRLFFPGFDPKPGDAIRANCFKCGDLTEVEHYFSWNPVDSPTPNFHRPEDFGRMVFA